MSEPEPSISDNIRYGDLRGTEKFRQVERDRLLWEQNKKLEEQNNKLEEQNQIELEKLQIEKEKIEAERETAELIAEIEEKRNQNEKDLEQKRQYYNDELRYNKLCDNFGIDYDDMIDFEMILNDDSIEAEQIYQDFYNFRKEHYARDMEILFRKLKFDFGIITKEEIKSNGTNDDYIDYIYDCIMNNTSLIESIKNFSTDKILYNVINFVIENQEVSVKSIQDEFNINNRRADRLIRQMKERAIIVDKTIMYTKEQWKKLMQNI